ncbi:MULTISPECIES: hypothetical protein [Endozoicomonas]|uniref:hypothetical protein n=1 Tax=Endozoicomonas TaxID=305899 RepID=UPI0013D28056|nr:MULTISPECIES: hypothetical protein [Endozoicomonas]WBA83230.1 hypothetical protein O2T12_08980 [Endozoicomonas sp. GU-1]WBA86155.1 hypothetical protein O3276_23610 [Endozoicomonas sp. GU-1]
MLRIEKYTLRDGQAGWQAHLVKPDCSKIHETRRFSYSDYGDLAFQEALDWLERQYYQPAAIDAGDQCPVLAISESH